MNEANSCVFMKDMDIDVSCDDLKLKMSSLKAGDFGFVVSNIKKKKVITMT